MTTERALVVQHLAYAALDALRVVVPLDLCAYLHVTEGDGPQLYLRTPDLSSMTATQAFDVFTALRDAVDGDEATTSRCRIGRFDAVAVRTKGPRSSGVFVVGGEESPVAADVVPLVESICRAMGDACHLVETAAIDGSGGDGVAVSRVAITVEDGVVEATVTLSGPAAAEGRARAASTLEAVVLATLEGAAPETKLVDVSDTDVGTERAVVVLLQRDDHPLLGAAIAAGDPLRAAAEATLVALRRTRA